MSIYAISDLHLSFGCNKPMDIFGEEWKNHEKKIEEDWKKVVKEEDWVLLPGDFSWGTYISDTYRDFEFLNKLPGKKLLLKGNHDYWWTTLASMRRYLEENKFKDIDFIYNNSYICDEHIIAGCRGWSVQEDDESKKMINREKQRLELSIKDGVNKFGEELDIIVCMHYPPSEEFIEIMKKYNVKKCLYGHLHGALQQKQVKEGIIDNIDFRMVSCDYTNFKLIKIV